MYLSEFREETPSYNTVFTLRDIRPSVRHEVRSGIGEAFQQQEAESAGHIRTT
jgi:hypothetical protein